MSLKRIPLGITDSLAKFAKQGGQSIIYESPPNKLIKIVLSDEAADATQTSNRLIALGNDENLFRGLSFYCAVPEALIERPDNNQIVGFQMCHFKDFESLGMLANVKYCVDNKVRVGDVANIFRSLHDKLRSIHAKGFIIGDFNPRNILFRMDGKRVQLAFIDVDSWAVRRPDLTLPDTANTRVFCHPELEEGSAILQCYHDWYSYVVLLTRSLVKADPFSLGSLSDSIMLSINGNSKKNGITCWDPRVSLTTEEKIYTNRFGSKFPTLLKKWLSGNERSIFPKDSFDEFMNGMVFCKTCFLEVHADHINCVKCGAPLPVPIPRIKVAPAITPPNQGGVHIKSNVIRRKTSQETTGSFLSDFLKMNS